MNAIHTFILFVLATAAFGQTQYAFTNFAGLPGGAGNVDGTGSAARFRFPSGVAADRAGNVYVADKSNNTIRKIRLDGVVTTLAGSAGQIGSTDGTGSAATFGGPWGVAVDGGGTVEVADLNNHTIWKITPAGEVTTLAGSSGKSGSADGTGSAALFHVPTAVAADSTGNLYVADSANFTVRKLTPAGEVTTFAGSAGERGGADGTGSEARFGRPTSVAVDGAGNLYVADTDNSTIRKITPDGAVATLAGTAGRFGSADGVGNAAQFASPYGVAVDSAGNVYVSDSANYRITRGTPLASLPLQFATHTGSPRILDGLFQMRVTGPSGSNVIVEASANLQGWMPIQTNALPSSGLDLSVRVDKKQSQFFRVRLAP